MIVRLVHLTFDPAHVSDFLLLFDQTSERILSSAGCTHLELLQHNRYPNMFTTYSKWESEQALQEYRSSDLFKQVWNQTKTWFVAPPVANSYQSFRKTS